MRVDVTQFRTKEHEGQGKITGPDGRGYARRGSKAKRARCDDLIAGGAPAIAHFFARGLYAWFDGDDAKHLWSEVRPYFISSEPTAKLLRKREAWTGSVLQADDGAEVVYLEGHC